MAAYEGPLLLRRESEAELRVRGLTSAIDYYRKEIADLRKAIEVARTRGGYRRRPLLSSHHIEPVAPPSGSGAPRRSVSAWPTSRPRTDW